MLQNITKHKSRYTKGHRTFIFKITTSSNRELMGHSRMSCLGSNEASSESGDCWLL